VVEVELLHERQPPPAPSRRPPRTSVRRLKTLTRSTDLPIDADTAWALVKRADTFRFVTWPLLGVQGDLPETLDEGETIELRLKLLNRIPANRHTITLVKIDDAARTAHTNERGGVLKTWNHTITVEPLTPTTCRYTDSIEIDAGRLTPAAYAIADAFFAHRQRRWHKLVG